MSQALLQVVGVTGCALAGALALSALMVRWPRMRATVRAYRSRNR